jgi:UDP-GlcNAc:undecaprenyl-phosphate GlcNAc-1-phosphate transferase
MEIPITQITESLAFILIGGIIATPLLLLNVKVAPRLGMIDLPKARGLAEDSIPIIGHSLVLMSLVILCAFAAFYRVSPWFVITATVMAIMGHLDDRKPLSALDKMFFQLLSVLAVVFLDPMLHESLVVRYGTSGVLWGTFFILGLINAINFIDGIDGLAGIVIMTGAGGLVSFCFGSGTGEYYPYFVYGSMLIGMIVPFLYLNVMKRKGFLGNVGSYFFSYVLALMHLSIPLSSTNIVSRLSISGLCFLIPIADSIMVILSRSLTFRSPFKADKGHLHHRLIQTSIALRYILINFALIEGSGLSMAFLVSRVKGVGASTLPVFLCLSFVTISTILILMAEKGSKRRMQGYFQRLDNGEPIYFLKYELAHNQGKPISAALLRRLEAKVSAEIRITDLCFSEKPNMLFVTLRTLAEPLKGISSRLDNVFQSENVVTRIVIDQGEFIKVSYNTGKASSLKTA